MLRLTPKRLEAQNAEFDMEAARQQFAERNWVRVPGFIEPSLLETLHRELARAPFYDRSHGEIGTELCLVSGALTAALELMANDPELLAVIEKLTGCGPLGCFVGRVYRMVPGAGHYDTWHSDVGENRKVAMSVNLSSSDYSGGVTEFRRVADERPFDSVANTGLGDAILFRIDPGLRHRVTPIEGREPKTAWAGWFRSSPRFEDLIRDRRSSASAASNT